MGCLPLNPRYIVSANRLEKATKIGAVLGDFLGKPVEGMQILDVGVGTGEIIDYFADRNQTYGVDVEDQRVSTLSTFSQVTNERLPFSDDTFDVVISNHVIEHVRVPELHLQEIARVLKPEGLAYLATPNRLFPKETHFKLWLMHYLPHSTYFRLARKLGRTGDRFWIFTPWGLVRLLESCGFRAKNYTGLILAHPERFHAKGLWPVRMGKFLGKVLSAISPTFIYVLFRAKESPAKSV
jgi:SAM-dependent methyltransferase